VPKPRRDPSTPHPQLVRFARVLKRARRRAGLSQQALGDLAQLSQGEVSMLEAGQRDPRLLTIVYLARALHMAPSELINELR
jgi:transcriptional regulator with XRE-family HTH domain